MAEERALFVLESINASTGADWVVEDHFREADLAEEQREWVAKRYPDSQFRVVRYVPEASDT